MVAMSRALVPSLTNRSPWPPGAIAAAKRSPAPLGDERCLGDLVTLRTDLYGVAVIGVHDDYVAVRSRQKAERGVQPTS
jgi:hypothetical protein